MLNDCWHASIQICTLSSRLSCCQRGKVIVRGGAQACGMAEHVLVELQWLYISLTSLSLQESSLHAKLTKSDLMLTYLCLVEWFSKTVCKQF